MTNTMREEVRKAGIATIADHMQYLTEKLGVIINMTPTGPEREKITEANIHFMTARSIIEALAEEYLE